MIDTATEELFPFSDLHKYVPGRPHKSTGTRWIARGVRGIKLETVLVGGRRFCSREALHRFFAATTAAADGVALNCSTPAQRDRDLWETDLELDREGL